MKNGFITALISAVLVAGLTPIADAKRLGGGKSTGLQRDMPARTAPDAAPGKPATPPPAANPGTNAAAPGAAAAPAAAAAAGKRSWLGPIAGLAAGLGLAALFSSMGLGAEFGNFVMLALLAIVAFFVIRFLLARFAGGRRLATPALATAGAGLAKVDPPLMPRTALEPAPVADVNVGMASTSATADAANQAPVASAAAVAKAFVPAAFDSDGFARTAKMLFIRMQAANDAADLGDLRSFTTPEMFAAVRLEIQERGSKGQHTDVQQVDAQVLDVAHEADRQVVSVRFTGQLAEEAGAAPVNFDEVWHLVRPTADGGSANAGWAIAGIEQKA